MEESYLKIILASSSPRRKELLKQIGMKFEICPPDYDQDGNVEETPLVLTPLIKKDKEKKEARRVVEKNALFKARTIARRFKELGIVIGADTIVLLGNEILGKPENEIQARIMLKRLSGKIHHVVTGISLIKGAMREEIVGSEVTEVKFRKLSGKEISNYIKTGEPLDKAGAYGIQGMGALFVSGINGCYFNVVGLPLTRLFLLLKEAGMTLL